MELEQFKVLVKGMKAVYTSDNFLPTSEAIKIWYNLLKDIPYDVLSMAIQEYMSTKVYPPTVAELRTLSSEITHGTIPDWGAGWKEVKKAISNYGIYQPVEAMNSLSPLTRQVVERIGFTNICKSENIEVERANFRMIYEQLAERSKKDAQLPEKLKNLIAQTQTKMIGG